MLLCVADGPSLFNQCIPAGREERAVQSIDKNSSERLERSQEAVCRAGSGSETAGGRGRRGGEETRCLHWEKHAQLVWCVRAVCACGDGVSPRAAGAASLLGASAGAMQHLDASSLLLSAHAAPAERRCHSPVWQPHQPVGGGCVWLRRWVQLVEGRLSREGLQPGCERQRQQTISISSAFHFFLFSSRLVSSIFPVSSQAEW